MNSSRKLRWLWALCVVPVLVVTAIHFSARQTPSFEGSSRAAPEASPSTIPPQGLYESCTYRTVDDLARCDGHLEQMAAADFKLVLNYDGLSGPVAHLVAYASHADALGMKVIWSMNDPVWWAGNAREAFPELSAGCRCASNTDLARYVIAQVAGLPGTWGYYLGDEVATNSSAARRYWAAVHAADPTKPTLVVGSEDQVLSGRMDATARSSGVTTLASDVYPIGRSADPLGDPLDQVGRSLGRTSELARAHGKAAGAVLQSYNWKKMYPEERWLPVERFPSSGDMRRMRDDALAAGHMEFLLWYSYFDLMNDIPWEQHWADLQWAAFGSTDIAPTITPTVAGGP